MANVQQNKCRSVCLHETIGSLTSPVTWLGEKTETVDKPRTESALLHEYILILDRDGIGYRILLVLVSADT